MQKLLTMNTKLIFYYLLLFAAFASCRRTDAPTPQHAAAVTYRVELANGGGKFTVDGSTSVTIMTADGRIVFKTASVDTTIIPPVDTTSIAGTPVLFGVNVNHYDPKEKQAQAPGTRFYLPIGWVQTERGFRGNPMIQAQKQFMGVDDYLLYMKSKNVDVLLTLMQSPDWLNGHNSGGLNTNDFPPIRPGLNREEPKSYAEVAGIYGTFAKRYGSKSWPVGSYKIDPAPPRWNGDGPQKFESALNLVTHIEAGNEKDIWWKPWPEYSTPKEHIAFLIAVYDSIKAADPRMKVVMAGLTNFDLKYLQEMKAECDRRGRKFPCDVINVHHYSNSGNIAGVHPPTWYVNQACAPELDRDMSTLAKIVAFAKSIGLPVWVTEYGYDTVSGSQMSPTPLVGMTNEKLQSDWNIRTALEHIRLGAVRSYAFAMADQPNVNGGLFQSCGMLYGEPRGYAEKPSFRPWVNFTNELRGFNYLADQSNATTRIMKFVHADGRAKIVYWSPTASNKSFAATIGGASVTVTESVQFLNINQYQ